MLHALKFMNKPCRVYSVVFDNQVVVIDHVLLLRNGLNRLGCTGYESAVFATMIILKQKMRIRRNRRRIDSLSGSDTTQ